MIDITEIFKAIVRNTEPEKPLGPHIVKIVEDCREEYGPDGDLSGRYGIFLGDYLFDDKTRPIEGSLKEMCVMHPEKNRLYDPKSGLFYNAEIDSLESEDGEDFLFSNPLILADNGENIWGIECWFAKAEDVDDISLDTL